MMTNFLLQRVLVPLGVAVVLGGCGRSPHGDGSEVGQVTSALDEQVTLSAFPFHVYPVKLAVPDLNCSSYTNNCTCMGVANGSTQVGAELGRETCNDSKKYQDWFVVPNDSGSYRLIPGHIGNMALGIRDASPASGARAETQSTPPGPAARWLVLSAGLNFKLKNEFTGLCLAADGSQQSCTGSSGFKLVPKYSFPFSITAKHSLQCLNVAWGSPDDGANVQQYPCGGWANERWYLEPVPNTTPQQYYFRSLNSGKCLDVANGSPDNNGNVQQYACIGVVNERWTVEPAGDDFFYIRNVNSSRCMTVANASPDPNANVDQYTCLGQDNQKWRFNYHVQRSFQFVEARNSDGTFDTYDGYARASVQTDVLDRSIEIARQVYRPFGIALPHSPAYDRSSVSNTGIYHWGVDTSLYTCADAMQGTPNDCVTRFVSAFQDKIVGISTRSYAGASAGNGPAVQLATGTWNVRCPDVGASCTTQTPSGNDNVSHIAHELGHFLGLNHTFDDDALADTPNDPHLYDCAGRAHDTAAAGVDTDNVMSYYVSCTAPHITVNEGRIVKATAYARFSSGTQ